MHAVSRPMPDPRGCTLRPAQPADAVDRSRSAGSSARLIRGLAAAALLWIADPSVVRAQVPPPIDLGIRNIPQETPVWCWAAVAQQVIAWITGGAPAQCQLVGLAYGAPPDACCFNPHGCMVTGHFQHIQGLIAHFGGRYSSLNRPTDPFTLYRTLDAGRAVILAVQNTPFAGHVVVLTGMEWMPTPFGLQPILYINDPMGHFTRPVAFQQLLPIWRAAIVVH